MLEKWRRYNVSIWSENRRRKHVLTLDFGRSNNVGKATSWQRCFDVVRRRDQKTAQNQRCHNFVCQLGWSKCQDKNLNILRTNRAFKVKWKAFSIIFKGFLLKQIKRNFFGRWESDLKFYNWIKGTLMHIWKHPYMFIFI